MRKSFFKGTHWRENALWKLELYKPAVWPHIKWYWPFVAGCKWYLTLAIITEHCWDRWTFGWGWAGTKRRRVRLWGDAGLCRGRPLVHYSGRQSFPPSWITLGCFFLLSLPLRGNSIIRPGIRSSHSELDRFYLHFSALWRQKLSRADGLRCPEGAPLAQAPRCWCGAGLTPLPIAQ